MTNEKLSEMRESVNLKLKKLDEAFSQIKITRKLLEEAEARRGDARLAQKVLQDVAQTVQNEVHGRIASVVSKCLSMVFDNAYDFAIVFEQKRGRTEARLILKRDDMVLEDPMEEAGGGVIDVASFALRLACLSLRLPKGRNFVALDEPFKHVSAEYRPRVRQMLEVLSEEMGFQFIMSTHMKDLITGTVVRLHPEEENEG